MEENSIYSMRIPENKTTVGPFLVKIEGLEELASSINKLAEAISNRKI